MKILERFNMATTKTHQTINTSPFTNHGTTDPFASQRKGATTGSGSRKGSDGTSPALSPISPTGRRYSGEPGDEWDASKTPPSRFQQRKGSIYATPNSRDSHLDRNHDRDSKYHEKLAEKGWGKKDRRGSKASN
ncbi:hypothetical protein HYFRA_00008729 [Hymenoscyphus fraxineus]|uniref:Uncharacterized protein n=1 Tax=Hymenoscyphus fraxineus TaxID=746836 RepID=A0A9N9PJI7_9HELO|nr:hypothetical protein HYFRA_00008729 [Hymenoscyphus fraxineus]